MKIPPLRIKSLLESNPLKSKLLIGGLGVPVGGAAFIIFECKRVTRFDMFPCFNLGQLVVITHYWVCVTGGCNGRRVQRMWVVLYNNIVYHSIQITTPCFHFTPRCGMYNYRHDIFGPNRAINIIIQL